MIVKKFNPNAFTIQFDDGELEYINQIAIKRKLSIIDTVQSFMTSGLAMFIGFELLQKDDDADTS